MTAEREERAAGVGLRELAVVDNYPDLIGAFRLRVEELDVTRLLVDELCDLESGYASKILSLSPLKGIGRKSLTGLLRGLGLKLVVVADDAAVDWSRVEKRHGSGRRSIASELRGR